MRRTTVLLICMLQALLVPISASAGPREEALDDPAETLHQLFASEWDYQMERHPTWASSLGDRRWNDRWEDSSLEAIEKDYQHRTRVLARLKAIDRSRLTPRDQLNYDLFRKDYEMAIEGHQYHWYLVPLNQRGAIQTADELADSLRFETPRDYEDWLARLRAFPAHLDQTIALMREGVRERMMLPKVIMQRVPGQIDKQIVADPEASPFFKPFRHFPVNIPEADRARLTRAAKDAIASGVIPAYRRFKQFFAADYLPACFDQVGVWQVPHGEELYAFSVRQFTTTNMTPKEVHELGLREVSRISSEMRTIIEKAGFTGTRAEFFKFLRTDPRFRYSSAADLFEAYKALAKGIDPNLVKVFKTLPRMPYGVEPIPDAVAPDTTTAYYRQPAGDGSRAGTFFVNLYRPEERPKWEMTALALHESVPGHHLQIALAMEQGELPKFRRYGEYTAFVEGWGLYAESLGEDMGLYDDPYSKFGQLAYEMWRAVRLVVDTGIHSMRWDRQKAIDYFMENDPKTEIDVTNEIDRYIAWPGQALAYKVGELKIKELRARAQSALGEAFDLREFHDAVLKDGAVPLDVLERNVDEWTKSKTRSAQPPAVGQK